MPAAYFEDLRVFEAWPGTLNLQGVSDFGPNDPSDYALEHCPEISVKRLRWVNDNSVNIEYYSPKDAVDVLRVLTDPQTGDYTSLSAQTSRSAIAYSRKPDSVLAIREANSGDQKPKNAAVRSQFHKKNVQVRERDQEREGGRRRQRDYLDYDGVDNVGPKGQRYGSQIPTVRHNADLCSASFNESMYDDNVLAPNDAVMSRDSRNGNSNRDRNGRSWEVDSYRPGARRYDSQ